MNNTKNTKDSQNLYSAFGALQEILYHAKAQDSARLAEFFGYVRVERCEAILVRFLGAKNMREWLKNGYYDMVYSAVSFLEKCRAFVNAEILDAEIALAKAENARNDFLNSGSIRIKTDFRRVSQPLFALAMSQSALYLPLCADKEWIYFSDDELLKHTQNRLVAHFVKCGGKIGGIFNCNITGYEMTLGGRKIDFSVQGEIISDSSNPSVSQNENMPKDSAPKVTLKVGKTDITNLFAFKKAIALEKKDENSAK